MQEVLQNDEKFSRVDRETVEAINLFAGTDIDIDEKEEVIDMCKAWEEQKNEGRELGREEGRKEGREEGREEGRAEGAKDEKKATARRLLAMGLSAEQVAAATQLSLDEIKKL